MGGAAERPTVRVTFREDVSFDPVFGVWRSGPEWGSPQFVPEMPDALEPIRIGHRGRSS